MYLWRQFTESGDGEHPVALLTFRPMSYVLAKQRDADVVAAFAEYRAYLHANKTFFPPSAYDLASSHWYFDSTDHRCPHDSWLESATIHEPGSGSRREIRSVALTVRLLGAYHDGYIEFRYPDVHSYELSMFDLPRGHGDWRFDEFRLGDNGRVIHEIEWATGGDTGRWLIEASDVLYKWLPGTESNPQQRP